MVYALIIWFVLFFSILLHELGHYWVAKKLGYKPTKFHFFTLPTVDKLPKNKFLKKITLGYNKIINTLTIKKKYKGLSIGIGLIPMPIAFVDLGKEESQLPRKDLLLTAIAGPLANIILFIVLGVGGLFSIQYFTNLPKLTNEYYLNNGIKGFSAKVNWDGDYKDLKKMFNTKESVTIKLNNGSLIQTIGNETVVLPKYDKYSNITLKDKITSMFLFIKKEFPIVIESLVDTSLKTMYYDGQEAVDVVKYSLKYVSPLTVGVVQFTTIVGGQTSQIIANQKQNINNQSLTIDIAYILLFTSILNIMLALTNLLPIPATDGFMIIVSLISIIYSSVIYLYSKGKTWVEPEMQVAWKLSMGVFILFIILIAIQLISDAKFIITSVLM